MVMNVGGVDRALRAVAGIALVGMAIAGVGVPWTWIGVVPLATAAMSWCPAYTLFGLNTCPMKQS